MRAIEGKNVTLKGLVDGTSTYQLFACATSLSFYSDEEQVEVTTYSSGRFREFEGGLNTWGANLQMVTHILPSTPMLTVFDLLIESLRRNGLAVEIAFVDDEGNLKTITGRVRIPRIGINSPVVGFSTDEIELLGTGSFGINTTLIVPPPQINGDVREYEYIATGGETSISLADFIGRTFLGVWRGYPLDKISTGTPTELQVKTDIAAGALFFATTAPFAAGEFIYINYK